MSQRRITAAEATWWDVLMLWYFLLPTPAGEAPTHGQSGTGPSGQLSQDDDRLALHG